MWFWDYEIGLSIVEFFISIAQIWIDWIGNPGLMEHDKL